MISLKKVMTDNYRSCQQIQNYSNLLCDETKPLYKEVNDLSSVVMLCTTTANWVSAVVPYLDKNKRCALLRYSNANSEIGAKELTEKRSRIHIYSSNSNLGYYY